MAVRLSVITRPTFENPWALASRPVRLSAYISIFLSLVLPFLNPFGTSRNIDMQGLLLLVAGGFAWMAVGLEYRQFLSRYHRSSLVLGTILIACCALSSSSNHPISENLLGAPLLRLGALGLIACIGCGLVWAQLATKLLARYLYGYILVLCIVSIPFSLFKLRQFERLPGIFAQADVMAAFAGCGILLGLQLLQEASRRRWLVLAGQCFLVSVLLLTQTRFVIGLTAILVIVWQLKHVHNSSLRRWAWYGLGALVLLTAFIVLAPNRLTNVGFASRSTQYRLALQRQGLEASFQKPWLGYGAGGVTKALDCKQFQDRELKRTCADGYYFNSSHNIYLDRILGLGYIGGLAYTGLVLSALYYAIRSREFFEGIGLVTVLIAGYYLSNVTNITLELLLWVVLAQCLSRKPALS